MPEAPVEIAAADGGKLRGTWRFPEGAHAPMPAVLMLHGLTLDQAMFESPAVALADLGIASLRLDLRAHGSSDGDLKRQGFEDQLDDVRRGLRALAGHPDADPSRLGLLGFSMGGAMGAIAVQGHVDIKALAVWSPLLKTGPWNEARQSQYGPPKDGLQEIWDGLVVDERLFSEALAHDPWQAALDFQGPCFICHGGKDKNHPQARSVELAEARQRAHKHVVSFFPPQSGHRYHNAEERAMRDALTAAFFASSL